MLIKHFFFAVLKLDGQTLSSLLQSQRLPQQLFPPRISTEHFAAWPQMAALVQSAEQQRSVNIIDSHMVNRFYIKAESSVLGIATTTSPLLPSASAFVPPSHSSSSSSSCVARNRNRRRNHLSQKTHGQTISLPTLYRNHNNHPPSTMIGVSHPFSIRVGPMPYLPLLTFVSYLYTFTTLGYSPNNSHNDHESESSSSTKEQEQEDANIQYFTEREISRWDMLQYEHESCTTTTASTKSTTNDVLEQTKTSTITHNYIDTKNNVVETKFSDHDYDDKTTDCPIEDDDCFAFSSLPTTLSSSSSATLNSTTHNNEVVIDQTCPIEDTDCLSFLPEIHDLYVTVDDATRISNELVARYNSITTTRIENNWRTSNCST